MPSCLTFITVATTRPETMLGDTAVAINPKDPRAAALRGKMVRLPIVGRVIPIVEDDYVVLPDANSDDAKAKFATGFLKVTPSHDPNDYEIGRRHGLPVINVMAPDGSISDQHGWSDMGGAGFLLGMDRYEARKAIVAWFRENGLLEDVKPYRHSVGHSYRSHVPIEPYLSDQWYVKVTDDRLAGAALRALAGDQEEAGGLAASAAGGGRTGVGPVDSSITGILPVKNVGSASADGTSGEVASSADETFAEANPTENHGRDAHATSHGRDAHDTAGKHGQDARDTWEGRLRFYPARYARTFQAWHENIRDWCISRQLWWGHRIPVWSKEFSNSTDAERLFEELEESFQCERNAVMLQSDGGRHIVHVCLNDDVDSISRILEERDGFTRDPDVLDTWFSSGLWPLSTLGWPDQTPELQTWNPSSVLCTAREIITLWVSRMVMFNLYLEDRLPFTDVFIHAMIQDGEGRKMSKSLGNGVDPLDIISSHGADALRFTLANMATNTQDVRMPVERDEATGRNTSPKFDAGRNFCNKLWNAARFVLSAIEDSGFRVQGSGEKREARSGKWEERGEERGTGSLSSPPQSAIRNSQSAISSAPEPQTPNAEPSPVDESQWSLADRWIVSRFNRTVEAANDALANYRFDQYAKACYDFFWGDFCDWYVEAVKPALRDPARKAQTRHVLAAVLDGTLRLMHPMIPFITEMLYQRLNEVCPVRGLPGRIECSGEKREAGSGKREERGTGALFAPQSAIGNSQSAIPALSTHHSSLLIKAPWPAVGDFSQAAEHIFPRLQEIITAIRNLRNSYNVPPKQPVAVSMKAPAEPMRQLNENREMIEALAICSIKEVRADLEPAAGAIRAAAAGVDIFVEGLVDREAEKQRLAKACEDLAKTIKTLRGRIENEAYIRKAPAALVQQTRDQLAAAEAERAKLGCG